MIKNYQNKKDVDQKSNLPCSININIDPSWAFIIFLKFAIVPVCVAIYIIMKISSGELDAFNPKWENITALLVAVLFSLLLFFYILHIYHLIRYRNNYLLMNSDKIYSKFRNLSIKWGEVENITLSNLSRTSAFTGDSLYISVNFAEPMNNEINKRRVVEYKWRLDGTNVDEKKLLICAKLWIKDGKTVNRL